jgi:MFS family permease
MTTISGEAPTFGSVLRLLFSLKVFVYLAIATALHVFCIYGLLNWAPSFLSRMHGMKNVDIGVSLGLIYGLGGAAGTYAGGYLTDHFGKKDRRFYLSIPAYAVLLSMVFIAGTIFLQSLPLTLLCLGACAFLQSMYLGPSLAVAHSLVTAPMRALTSAVLFFVLNFFGQGFGPLIVGLISDALKPQLGIESLRWALSILLVMAFGAAMMFFAAAKKLRTAE